jgi:UDP-N-acetylmuramate dehydrogenase
MMKILTNVPLKKYNTFALNYKADYFIHITSIQEAIEMFNGTMPWERPFLILGGGSNLLFISDFIGSILYPDLRGITIEDQDYDQGKVIVSAGAGVNWDDFVDWTVNKGFGGLENLSFIPGKVGATPVQNIGAYGVEVSDLIVKVEIISTKDGSLRIFRNKECEFGYRNSIFKNRAKGKYLVTRVYFCLSLHPSLNLGYGSLTEEVKRLGNITLKNVRQAVINIRKSKLPDPELIGNAGSFFKNSVVNDSFAEHLKIKYPEMPVYEDRAGYKKIASGWLIDYCGWKGKRKGDAGVHDKQALVLINYGNATGKEIYELSEEIRKSVYQEFGIEMEREAEIIGFI